ncbi:GNAT family N-acetyltransferase [Deinococcus ruber]|uniref:Ribosomal protein N-acetyltransferase n=1 Tax=Deinococcus ruber TaxID=1848197 RepID=A0A918F498_9DEIO|nr:GNAT family N-acetyltransferase [Deinococcus ruber]GGQ99657.1 ribosomal protein N-acetyltransferase [Deinococcus ruber]
MKPDHVPASVQTPRLLLRAPRPDDAPAVYRAVMASLPELRRWMEWAQQPLDEAGYRENLTRAAERFVSGEELRYLVWDAAGEILLGSSGFHALNWSVPKGEIGYWIDSRHTGQGYATETARALTDFGFDELGFRRIEIRCDALNAASAAVAARLGFTLDARLINDKVAAHAPHELRDTLIFSRVR